MPMFRTPNSSSACTPAASATTPNTAGTSHEPRSMIAPSPSGRIRGTFSPNPPPVMWAAAWTAARRAISNTSPT